MIEPCSLHTQQSWSILESLKYQILFITAGKQLSDGPPSPPGFSCFRAAAALLSVCTNTKYKRHRQGATQSSYCSGPLNLSLKKKRLLTPPSANTDHVCGVMARKKRTRDKPNSFLKQCYRTTFSHAVQCEVQTVKYFPIWDPKSCLFVYFYIFFICEERLSEDELKRARFISASVAYTYTFKAHCHKWNMYFFLQNKLSSNK